MKQVRGDRPMSPHPDEDKDMEYVSVRCDSCAAVAVNGLGCHEQGCPDSWLIPDGSGRAYPRSCRWCGSAFEPEHREQRFCDDACSLAYSGD